MLFRSIKVNLLNGLEPGDQIKINLNYVVKIPDDKFTGVGINSGKGVLLRDLFVTVAPRYNDEWLLNSNLGFRDYSSLPSDYSFQWSYPADFNLLSNLNEISAETSPDGTIKTSLLGDEGVSSDEFVFD